VSDGKLYLSQLETRMDRLWKDRGKFRKCTARSSVLAYSCGHRQQHIPGDQLSDIRNHRRGVCGAKVARHKSVDVLRVYVRRADLSCAYDIAEFDFPAMPRVSISPNRSHPPTSSMQPKVKFRCCRHGSTSTGAAQTPVLVMKARLGRRGAGYGLDGRGLQDVSLGIQIVGARA
jgi:hypothetical protein